MKKLLILCALLTVVAAPVFAQTNPGIDLTANFKCSTTASNVGASNGGTIDCNALATAAQNVRIYCTLIPAEAISDANGLDGQLDVAIVGDWATSGAFWDMNTAGCQFTNSSGATPKFLGGKPSNGDPCGTALSVKQVWADLSSFTTNVDDAAHERVFFGLATGNATGIAAGQRAFGFELRLDPVWTVDAGQGGTCGTCSTPVCYSVQAKPASQSGSPTTLLTSGTGNAGVTNQAFYNAGCQATPAKKRTWGQLKSLYR
jgi:hypothetical protein